MQAVAGPLGDTRRVASPAGDGVLEHGARLVARHPAPVGQLVGERLDAVGRERDGADGGQRQPLDDLSSRTTSLGHGGEYGGADGDARASPGTSKSRRHRKAPAG